MNTLAAQIRDLFESMTAGARITAGLLLVVAVASIAYLFQHTAAGPDAFLFGGERFSQAELTRMEAAMASAGLSGWSTDSNRISVPRALQQDAIAAIANAGALPDNFADFMDDALSKASPMEGRQQWELRTKSARESQLSLLVSKFDWVESAQVMVDIQQRRGFNRNDNASASVFVTPKPGERVDKIRSRNIKKLVAGPFASMNVDSVQITSSNGDIGSGGEPVFDDIYLQARAELQKAYKQQIMGGLDYIPGVRVEVSADLTNKVSETITRTVPGESKALRTQSDRTKEESSVSDGGGQPGLPAQGPARRGLDEGLAKTNSTIIEQETSNEENFLGFETSVEENKGFKPKELYASIAIPREYVVDVWQQKNPEGDPTTLTDTERTGLETSVKIDVERFVQNILPRLSLGEDEYQQVEVVFFDSIKRAPPAEPSFADTALVWTGQYWGTLSMIGLAGVSLLMLRSAIRPSNDGGSPNASTMELDFGNEKPSTTTEESQDESERPKLRIKKSVSLKEDLSDMVREDPDAAANILRAWINNAG
ncbi:hypothetical protein N9N28_13040 [Rubripirellula amarantea]|nr:hypothetical protein [Rubripirellula amarantea]